MIKERMQGLPTNLLAQNVVASSGGKPEAVNTVSANTKVALVPGQNPEQVGDKNAFASLFGNLIGEEKKVQGQGEAGKEKAQPELVSAEAKADMILKTKSQEQDKKTPVEVLSPEKALSPEVLKNIDTLLAKTPNVANVETNEAAKKGLGLEGQVVKTGSNLDQLLQTLKGEEGSVQNAQKEGETSLEGAPEVHNKKSTPLDFLLKEAKGSEVGNTKVSGEKILEKNPEFVSKLGLSGEEFVKNMAEVKEAKAEKVTSLFQAPVEDFDPKAMVQKQMNQSMKAYGQKQNLLNDNVIRNTKDLAFKDQKPKSAIDELKSPEMKIGAELGMVKEAFIPIANNNKETAPQMATSNSEKVLDLSKLNTSNTTEIIKRISDYVEQNQVANKDSLDLTVKHDSLGQFKIQVSKSQTPGANQMDMQITTSTPEGHEFFMKNETGLLKNLSQAGIQLSDLRIVSSSDSMSAGQGDFRQSNGQGQNQAGREFMSFDSGDFSNGSQRRKELWQEARENQQRYGA